MKNFEERYNEFMKFPKKALAALLAISDMEKEVFDEIDNSDNSSPEWPKDYEPLHRTSDRCTSWDKCGNPHMDCINCPLRGKPGNYTINGHGTFSNNTFKEGDGQFVGMDQYQFTC